MKIDLKDHFSMTIVSNLLNSIPHGIAVVDDNLKIVIINEQLEAFTGLASSDVQGVFVDFVLRSNISQPEKTFREVLNNGESVMIEGDIVSRDRRRVPMQFTISPLSGESATTIGLVIVLDDLSAVIASSQLGSVSDDANAIIGQSPKMREVFNLIPLMAHTEASVLITGETGTGKDKIAEAIHKRSNRASKPFIKINCGALPESLLESELFGYVKGAFTGAVKDKPGMFKLAQGGTLFLTEIGDMPLPLQVKLLSVLDDHEFFPLGSERKTKVDVRIIAATHRPLKQSVAAGEFREDLYYRLNVLHLHLPALRERENDARFLINHFLRLFAERVGKEPKTISESALQILLEYPYPGNIRELRNIIEYCVNICPEKNIEEDHLPKFLTTQPLRNGTAPVNKPEASHPIRIPTAIHGDFSWLAIERNLIIDTLTKTRGNRCKAADILGWSRSTLWRKLKNHGLVQTTENKGIEGP